MGGDKPSKLPSRRGLRVNTWDVMHQWAKDKDGQDNAVDVSPDNMPQNSKEEPAAPHPKPKRKKHRTKVKKLKRVRKKSKRPKSERPPPDLATDSERGTAGSAEITPDLDRVTTKEWLAKDQERHKQQVRLSLWGDASS